MVAGTVVAGSSTHRTHNYSETSVRPSLFTLSKPLGGITLAWETVGDGVVM